MHAIHFSGVGKEKADLLLRSASIGRSFNWNPFRFNLTGVVEMICPSISSKLEDSELD